MPALTPSVSLQRSGPLAVVCVDNPPVNALSGHVIEGLEKAIDAVERDREVRLVLLRCADDGFVAGADLKEPITRQSSDHNAKVINRIAFGQRPWIAVVGGAALGGGLELALACDYRCAAPTARFGLPEVNLGAVPGYGGTQRLPRILGLENALQWMLTGDPHGVSAALEVGLVDQVIEGPLLEGAVAWAHTLQELGAPSRKTDDRLIPDAVDVERICQAGKRWIAEHRRGEDAPPVIVECTRVAATQTLRAGLAYERRQSTSRIEAPQCQALRYLFLAERQVRKDPGFNQRAGALGRRLLQAFVGRAWALEARGVGRDRIEQAHHEFGWAEGPFSLAAHHLSLFQPEPARPDQATSPTGASGQEIVQECLQGLCHAAREAISDGAAATEAEIDVLFCTRFGFPRYRGGPMIFLSQTQHSDAATAPAPSAQVLETL